MTTKTVSFEDMTTDERWLGWGYLGERKRFLDETDPDTLAGSMTPADRVAYIAKLDAQVLTYAAGQRWSAEKLFRWANSRTGRHFADWMFGSSYSFDHAVKVGLLRVPRA